MFRKGTTRMVAMGVTALLALSLAPAAQAQNGFPAAKAAVDQYEPPPQPPPNPGQGNAGGNRPPGSGNEASRPNRNRGARGPAGGAGPDSASGGNGPGGGVRSARGGALPLAQAEGGRLPFTGLDLLMVATLGALLMAAGFGVRIVSRARVRRA